MPDIDRLITKWLTAAAALGKKQPLLTGGAWVGRRPDDADGH